MSAQTLQLLACQINIPPTTTVGARDEHLRCSSERVRQQLLQQHTDLVVLPELSSVDYARACFAELSHLAEPLLGPSFQAWSSVAKEFNTIIVFGFPRRTTEGEYRICAAAAGPDGQLIGSYDKLHLAQFGASMEQEYFSPGEQLFVFEVNGFRLAPIICFDIRPPELCRQLVVEHQVDVILHTGAYYRDPSFSSWHAFAQTRAVENQIYFLSLNRAGQHYGDSLFVPPWIDEHIKPSTFPAHAEAFQVYQLERSVMDTARRDYAFLAERLPDYQLPLNSVS